MLYQEGKKMAEQIGKEQEAIQLLTEAIEKHDRHSQAYEKELTSIFILKIMMMPFMISKEHQV